MNPGMMVQMHYGSFVYMLKAHLHGVFELTDDSILEAIRSCWNAVLLMDAAVVE
jgi:hypothetical protein